MNFLEINPSSSSYVTDCRSVFIEPINVLKRGENKNESV